MGSAANPAVKYSIQPVLPECKECTAKFDACSGEAHKVYIEAVQKAVDSSNYQAKCQEARTIRDEALEKCMATYLKCCRENTKPEKQETNL